MAFAPCSKHGLLALAVSHKLNTSPGFVSNHLAGIGSTGGSWHSLSWPHISKKLLQFTLAQGVYIFVHSPLGSLCRYRQLNGASVRKVPVYSAGSTSIRLDQNNGKLVEGPKTLKDCGQILISHPKW